MKISRIIFKYLIKTFLNSFITVFGIIASLIAIFDLIDLLHKSAGKVGLSQIMIFKMLCLRLPIHVQEVLPFIILFTAILTFWRLNRYSEIIILRTTGLSIWQFLSPLILCAFLIGLVDLIFLSPFASKMIGRFEFYESKYLTSREQVINLNNTGIWLRETLPGEARIYRVSHIDEYENDKYKNKFYNLSVYIFSDQQKFIKRYDAHTAYLYRNQFRLEAGTEITSDEPPNFFDKVTLSTHLSLSKIQNSIADPRTLPFWKLPSYYQLMENAGLSGQRYLLRFHNLLANTLWLAVMVIFAATFSLSHVRMGQTSKMIILGVASAFLLYFFREIMISLSQSGKIPNFLGAWATTCITGMAAITKLLYSEDG